MICKRCGHAMRHTTVGWACFNGHCQLAVTYSSGTDASLQKQLETERARVRVLREALNRIIDRAGSLDSARLMCDKALAATTPEGGDV